MRKAISKSKTDSDVENVCNNECLISDEMLRSVMEEIKEKLNGKIIIADPSVYSKIAAVYASLKKSLVCDSGDVVYDVSNVVVGRLCLSIVAKGGVTILDGDIFAEAVADAENIDVFPLKNGCVQIDIMFRTNVSII